MEENMWSTIIKGLVIGAAMLVPGASGGTMAIILGIYDRLISAVSSFGKNVKGNLLFLAVFGLSTGVGMFLFSTPVSWLLEHHEIPTICFFIIVILCGVPVIGRKSGVEKVRFSVVMYMLLGAIMVVCISKIPENVFQTESFVGLIVAGIFSAAALILPGISFSHFLLILGIYEHLLAAVKMLEFKFLFPLGAGVLLGVILLSKLLESLMEKYPKQTYMIILGFILGSAGEIIAGF